jgi:hypothetical protein
MGKYAAVIWVMPSGLTPYRPLRTNRRLGRIRIHLQYLRISQERKQFEGDCMRSLRLCSVPTLYPRRWNS